MAQLRFRAPSERMGNVGAPLDDLWRPFGAPLYAYFCNLGSTFGQLWAAFWVTLWRIVLEQYALVDNC